MLGMPEARVRELARDALVELAPVSVRGVEDDWRGQLADYVLGQQSGPESTATRGHLRRSEAARAWARSLLDSLEQLYANGPCPRSRRRARPRRARGRGRRARRGPPAAGDARAAEPRARALASADPVMRRRLLAGAGRGGRAAARRARLAGRPADRRRRRRRRHERAATAQPAGPGRRRRQQAAAAAQPAGDAIVADAGRQAPVIVQAAQLAGRAASARPTRSGSTTARATRKSLGAPGHRPAGQLPGRAARCPRDYAKYKFIDVSREPIERRTRSTPASRCCAGGSKLRDRPHRAPARTAAVLGQTRCCRPSG